MIQAGRGHAVVNKGVMRNTIKTGEHWDTNCEKKKNNLL